MNREIKFRAWDGEYMYMPDEHGLFAAHDKEEGGHLYQNLFRLKSGDRYQDMDDDKPVIMQYTGLKDKNGKEAYHKDIVTVEGFTAYKTVEWDNEGAYFYLKCTATTQIIGMGRHPFEIVGNIYQNPDLLK